MKTSNETDDIGCDNSCAKDILVKIKKILLVVELPEFEQGEARGGLGFRVYGSGFTV